MVHFLAESAGNPGRGAHRLARAAVATIDAVRRRLAAVVNAERPERVVLTHGCTDAINIAIHGLLLECRKAPSPTRPHVVISAAEHNAIARTVHAYARDGLIEMTVVPCDAEGFIAPGLLLGAVREETVLVCLSHASNAAGTIQPVAEVGRGLRRMGSQALFLVDGAQTAGHVPIDVQGFQIDLLSLAGHKGLLGPTGTGALYVGPRAYADDPAGPRRLMCTRAGGTGAKSPGLDMPAELPDVLEAGTSNAVGFAGLLAALEHHPPPEAGAAGDSESFAHEIACAMRMIEGLSRISGVRIHGRRSSRGRTGVVLFTVSGYDPRELGALLDSSFSIAVRAGLHCAPLMHQALGTAPAGGVRASCGPSTTFDEVDALVEAVGELASAAPAGV